jgi:uncharacterized membrane protein YfcA
MPHIYILVFLGLTGLAAGCIDTIAGGGGLIGIPAMLLAGMPPALALGTNKFQASFGSFSASYQFLKSGHLKLKQVYLGVIYTAIGAAAGTTCILIMNDAILKKILPIMLVIILIYMIFNRNSGHTDSKQKMKKHLFFLIFGFALGFYDGFFGPGTGSFWAIAIVYFLGFNLQKATMHTKVYNFISNIVALIWFLVAGHVAFTIGIVMAIGQIIGAKIGAYLVINKGTKLIRPIFITMVLVMTCIVVVKYYG